jgi:hypothetical protein
MGITRDHRRSIHRKNMTTDPVLGDAYITCMTSAWQK